MTISNINFFIDNFTSYDKKIAIIWRDESFSYSYILERINYWIHKLEKIPKGSIVGLESDFTPETISILFSLIEKQVIIVPLDINHSSKNIKKIGIAQLDFLIKINNEVEIELLDFHQYHPKNNLYSEIKKSSGLVLFTSGSSGEPKGALHNFDKLLLKFKVRRKALTTINFLLFDHWGGLNTLFYILSNGGTVVTLDNRNPSYVCELIEKHKVELLPTSPTFLNMLFLSRAYKKHSLQSLKVISYGSEPMPENLLKIISNLFPNIKLHQTYGLIELGVMNSKSEDNSSLWVKIGGEGFETRVINGMLEIKSDSVMLGYLNSKSPFTKDGWFITGDAVEVNGEYFKILGRKSELINVGGEKVFPQEIENMILSISQVLDVKVYGEKNPFTGNIVCAEIFVKEPKNFEFVKREIKMKCRKNLESYKVPVKISLSDKPFYSSRFKKNRIN